MNNTADVTGKSAAPGRSGVAGGANVSSVVSGADMTGVPGGSDMVRVADGADVVGVPGGSDMARVPGGADVVDMLGGADMVGVPGGADVLGVVGSADMAGVPGGPVVTVVGIGDDGWPGLTDAARAALLAAPAIVGGSRQLALLAGQPGLPGRLIQLPAPLFPQLDELVAAHPGLCVLASGDPMLHGIGATLARRLGTGRMRVLPAVSSVALACARLGWAEHEIAVVSVVSRPPETIMPAVQPGARVLVLCRDGGTPAVLAALLAGHGWSATRLTVLEHLGGSAERMVGPYPACSLPAGPFADLCVAALTCQPDSAAAVRPRSPGLPDDAYETDGQLTRRELRVLAVAALAPGPGHLLWDVGAGSGSVGIEWMRADPAARAIAIEARADRADRIRRNAISLGVPHIDVIRGTAPAALAGLARPDAVFIGGGLTADGVLETCWQALPPGGRLVAHAVTIESEAILHEWQRTKAGQLVKLAVSYAGPLGGFTTWRPALPVTQWQVIRP